MEKRIFTSESVTEGHPDKICDAISDAILDALMEKDPMSRVACETAITTGMVLVIGEITTNAYIDMQQVIRETIKESVCYFYPSKYKKRGVIRKEICAGGSTYVGRV